MILQKMVIYFTILSFIGYIYECAAMTFWLGHWDNRGFLYGPIIPIYGAGALFATVFFEYVLKDYTPLGVFLTGMIGTAVLEYIVHYTMEKLFHNSWWDYSKSILNINGRVCLPASIGFGIGIMLIIYGINPYLLFILNRMNQRLLNSFAVLFTVLIALDVYYTVKNQRGYIGRMDRYTKLFNARMNSLIGVHKAFNVFVYRIFEMIDKKDRSQM